MGTTREQLVEDWRQRLATAESSPPEDSPRAQWLARVRIRLYRFLLSLYGSGQWQVSTGETGERSDVAAEPQLPEDVDLAGKPAKNATQIREALSAFAAARSSVNQPGPWMDGTGDEQWLTIATLSGGIDPQRLSWLLQSRGIPPRVRPSGRDREVQVRAKQQPDAWRIMLANVNDLRWFNRPVVPSRPGLAATLVSAVEKTIAAIPPRWRFRIVSAIQLALVFPLASLFAAVMSHLVPPNPDPLVREYRFDEFYWTGLRGLFLITIMLIWLRAHWASRRTKSLTPEAS